jgi:NIMA (never in mitosis gene a)-related kinase
MKGLVFKILKGTYPPIPSHYSENTKELLAEMLTKDPSKRPSIKKILDKEFLSSRISQLFTKTVSHQQQIQKQV